MLLKVLLAVYSAIALAVQLVEDSKDGLTPEEAKAAALKAAKEMIQGALGGFPWWLPEFILGYIIDMIVKTLNDKGVFQHKSEGDAPVTAQSIAQMLGQQIP